MQESPPTQDSLSNHIQTRPSTCLLVSVVSVSAPYMWVRMCVRTVREP